MNNLSKLRLLSFKLAILTGKSHKTKERERIHKLCDLNKVEDEFQFLLQQENHKHLWKEQINYTIFTEFE